MIICVSINPAIDRRLRLARFVYGAVNRAYAARGLVGGKAAHVAMAARALGAPVLWLGFLGGATGDECERGLTALGINVAAVRTATTTRTNLELIADDGTVTEILEAGGDLSASEIADFLKLYEELCGAHDEENIVCLSGSLPPGAPLDLYAQLTEAAHVRGCRVLLDSSNEPLLRGTAAKPDLVKPNRDEAAAIFKNLSSAADGAHVFSVADATRAFLQAGARSVAVSLGERGLIWRDAAGGASLLQARPPRVAAVRSTVGCGDATLAGFAVAHLRGMDEVAALKLAAACGTANCTATEPGMIDADEVRVISERVLVTTLDETSLIDF